MRWTEIYSKSKSDSGFSLVETLIATFIFAIISAMAVALISNYQTSRLGLQSADERLAQLQTARAVMRDDFFSVVNRPVRDQFGAMLSAFEGGQHMGDGIKLRLVRGGDAGAKLNGTVSQVKRIDYMLIDGNLTRRTYVRPDTVPGGRYTDQRLLEGVEAAELRYASDGIWSDEWGTNAAISPVPRLAELSLRFLGGQEMRMTFVVGAPT